MSKSAKQDLEAVSLPTFSWKAGPESVRHLRSIPTISRRLAYVVMETELNSDSASISYDNGAAVVRGQIAHLGVPVRNQINTVDVDWADAPFVVALRETDSFGEVLIELDPAQGKATAYSVTIDRILKGGVSHSSPSPEEQMIERIGRYEFSPIGKGAHRLVVKAVEEEIRLSIDGSEIISFTDPDIAGGCFGIGSAAGVRVLSFEQVELVTAKEAKRREKFVEDMTEFCRELDKDYDADVARNNSLTVDGDKLTWTYPDTGAKLELEAAAGSLMGSVHAGMYGNPRMLAGVFAYPEITSAAGEIYRPAKDRKPALEGDSNHFSISIPLESDSGKGASISLLAEFTENATWFCTAAIEGVDVKSAALAFGLDKDLKPNWAAAGAAGKPAQLVYGTATLVGDSGQDSSAGGTTASSRELGIGAAPKEEELTDTLIFTDSVVGHYWKALSGQDTKIGIRAVNGQPTVVLYSGRSEFRWATMWMPYHKLNLTGYKKRMLHFIRQPERPYSEWRERPAKDEYPTDEELERFASHGVKAMVWHHTWTGNNSRERDGFVVNEPEMSRSMKKAHKLGITVIPYIGIVPGRNPMLRYEDLSVRAFYDKNWDLQDFTFYSVAGRMAEFLPYMTDYWCNEYGLDGFYTDGGLATLDWGNTGLGEKDFGGKSLEELNNRLYSRIKRVLRRNKAGFGLENWGGSPIHLAGPFYECRMIGETYQEYSPETYRDAYNPLLTGTPFKMYGMDLTARNRFNVAMAGVCMTDIQICSGNYAWGCWPDRPSDWKNLTPLWSILDSIDWDNLVDAKPWWAQTLVDCDELFAGHYTTPDRVVLFLANRREEKAHLTAAISIDELPEGLRQGRIRPLYPETGEWRALGDGKLEIELPRLHDGPIGFEIAGGTP